ncbi:MAG: C10 family peptidase [Bacteroidales bacterium]|nr:C10 family peptidase [Bacteroidales bacterium]
MIPVLVWSEGVPSNRLEQLSVKAFQQCSRTVVSPEVQKMDFIVRGADTLMAVVNFRDGGFVIMSADDAAIPVLAFSETGNFDLDNMAPATRWWLSQYEDQISEVKRLRVSADAGIMARWNDLSTASPKVSRDGESVAPLIQAIWNQSQFYNDLCPEDANSPYGYGGRVPCGCVGLAMAMVIHYYRYPAQAQGNHSYHSDYGYHSVNYSQQTYNYNAMPYSVGSSCHEVAKLIYHCAVAVDMGFAAEGSGAQTADARSALRDYYKYANDIEYLSRGGGWGGWGGGGGGYTTEQWIQILKQDLNQNRPVIYSGYSEEGGHAFVCDGYNTSDLFHFNWGWGGVNNGYFTVESANDAAVGGYNTGQAIVHKIHPSDNAYPYFCQDVTITSTRGSLEDGSGPSNYQDNSHCTYIIAPVNGRSVTITFNNVQTEAGTDTLSVYDGDPNNGGQLLTTRHGGYNNPSDCAYSSTGVAYLVFSSNGSVSDAGWKVSYTARRNVQCSGTTVLGDPSGTFDDGSEDEEYASDAKCYWKITPRDASFVSLSFNAFDFSPEDQIMIYDGLNENSANLLATYTGSTIPASVRSNTGKMMVKMVTDNYLQRAGFEATWTSDGVEEGTGIAHEPDAVEFNIFPNPAQTSIYVDVPSAFRNGQVSIYDLDGRIVCVKNAGELDSNGQISVAGLANGVYVVTLSNASDVLYKKMVISK